MQAQLIRLVGSVADGAGLVITDSFNLGGPEDFRVPDFGLRRPGPEAVWLPTAALVVEVESPDDETWDKLPFYASHGVDELVVVSAKRRSVTWLILEGDGYRESDASRLLGPESASLADQIDWPATAGDQPAK